MASATPSIFLVSRSTSGEPLAFGSGWADGNNFLLPLVSDQGSVSFIAPDPTISNTISPQSPYRTAFHAWPMQAASDSNPSIIYAGHESFLGTLYAMPIWHLAAIHPDLANQCFAVQEGTIGAGNSYIQLLGPNFLPPHLDITNIVPKSTLAKISLQMSRNGEIIAIGTDNGAKFWQITDTAFQKIDLAGTPLAASVGRVALSTDGQIVGFTSRSLPGANGFLCLYRYDFGTNQLELVATAENAVGSLDSSQVAITSDGETIAFVANNYLLWNGNANDGRGTQVMIAERNHDSTYSISLASTGALVQASDPALSDDGRFIAFKAGNTSPQIYRLDRSTQAILLASQGEDGLPANQACHVPTISPNGRYVALVSNAENLSTLATNGLYHTWLADFGANLTGGTLPMEEATSAQLPLTLVNANPEDKLQWSSDDQLPGDIKGFGAAGEVITIVANTNYPTNSLPWSFTANAGAGENDFTVKLLSEDNNLLAEATIELKVRLVNIAEQSPLSLNSDNDFVATGALPLLLPIKLGFDEDGHKIAFTTNISLHPDDPPGTSWDIYLRQVGSEISALTLLTEGVNISAYCVFSLSGDGNTLFHTTTNSLRQINLNNNITTTTLPDTAGITAIASSYDGTTLALVINGKPTIYSDNNRKTLDEQIGNATKALLSRDGQTAAFLTDAGDVHVWCEADQSWRKLAENVSHFSMPLDGGTLCCQDIINETLTLLATGTGEFSALSLAGLANTISTTDLLQPTISGNGQFLVYFRTNQRISQLYRYDLATHQENMMSAAPDGLPGNDDSGIPLAISSNGERIAYVTTATNVLPGKPGEPGEPGNTRELALAILPSHDGDAPTLQSLQVAALEAAEIIIPLALESNHGVALPMLTQQPQHATASIIGPATGRNGHALKIVPHDQYFCGKDEAKIKIFDGRQWSDELTLQLTIENVNNPPVWLLNDIPESVTKIELLEGQLLTDTPGLAQWAEDHDLRYVDVTNEKLSFSLQNAPEWLMLNEDNRLVCSEPPSYDLARRDENNGQKDFVFQVLVTDLLGECAELEIKLTVINVNRPPEISAWPERIFEGNNISWPDFQVSDPDQEDQNALQIVFAGASKGTWQSLSNPGAGPRQFTAADFPIVFQANAGTANSDQVSIHVIDGAGDASSTVTVPVLLRQFSLPLSELWPANGANAVLPAQYPGWAMLTAPVDIDDQQLLPMLTDSAWLWDAATQTYTPFDDTKAIEAGMGFCVYFLTMPDFSSTNLTGTRDFALELPSTAGWHLLGTPYTYLLPATTTTFTTTGQHQVYQRVTSQPDVDGRAYWIFQDSTEP